MEVAILLAHPEWYAEFLRISSSFNSGIGASICPGAYHCNHRELFAEATQVWFSVTTRSDVVQFISSVEDMRQITIPNDSGTSTTLYDFMTKVYGEPRELCNVLQRFEQCSGKCKH